MSSRAIFRLLSPAFVILALLFSLRTRAVPSRPIARATYDPQHKLGLGWTDTSVDIGQFTSAASWYYNWGPAPNYDQGAMDGLEYVPMFWGNKSIPATGALQSLVISGNVTAVLGMNEPTVPGQSVLTPAEGAALWMQYIQPLKSANSSIRLGSPSMTNGPAGIPWMQQFIGNCTGCTVDFLALHYYYISASDFESYLNGYYQTFQKPVWVTEWACANFGDVSQPCTDDQVPSFMAETQAFMDNTSWVERYSWFGEFKTPPYGLTANLQLYDGNGKITSLGSQYVAGGNLTSGARKGKGTGGEGGGSATSHGVSLITLSLGIILYGGGMLLSML